MCSRVNDDVPFGYEALQWESILHGNAGSLGDYAELSLLPDKISRFLYEYYFEDYTSMGLPPLLADRSNTDVQGF